MKAVFFDRDGIINEDYGYVYSSKEFVFIDGVFELLNFCKQRDFLLLLITNQSGIGRGYYTLSDFEELSSFMQKELKQKLGFGFDNIYFCPHDPDENCLCRKPNPGMIEKAKKDYNLDLKQCFLIGDKMSDIQAGFNAKVEHNILLKKSSQETIENTIIALSLKQIISIMKNILGE